MRKDDIGAALAYCGCVTDDRNNLMWSYLFTASKRLVITTAFQTMVLNHGRKI